MKGYICPVILVFLVLMNNQAYSQLTDALRLTVSSGSYSDETIIRFLDVATDSFDADYDGYKLMNGGNTPNLYTVTKGEDYVINALNCPYTQKDVSLHLRVAIAGNYTLTPEELGAFDSTCHIVLLDKVLDITTDLRTGQSYSFDMDPADDPDRFLLTFSTGNTNDEPGGSLTSTMPIPGNVSFGCYYSEGELNVNFSEISGNVSIVVFNRSGKILAELETAGNSGLVKIGMTQQSTDIVIVQLVSEHWRHSEKIYIGNF